MLLACLVLTISEAEAGWYEYDYRTEYGTWYHNGVVRRHCDWMPKCWIEVKGSEDYDKFSHKVYLFESASAKYWKKDLEYYYKWYRYYYDRMRHEWGTEHYTEEDWEQQARTVYRYTIKKYCEREDVYDWYSRKWVTVTNCTKVAEWLSSTWTETRLTWCINWWPATKPWEDYTLLKNNYRYKDVLEGPFTREGPYTTGSRNENTADPPYYVKEWLSGPYDVIARVTYEKDLQHNHWETRRNWGMHEYQKYYRWKVYFKHYTKTGYEKETSRTLLGSGTNDHGIKQTGYDVLKQWTETIEGPYVWRYRFETLTDPPYTQKNWTSNPYDVLVNVTYDKDLQFNHYETRRNWEIRRYQKYYVYRINYKYYTKTAYEKDMNRVLDETGINDLGVVNTGYDVLNRYTTQQEGPYVWANYTETRYGNPYTRKEWTSPEYTVPAQRWHDRFYWNVRFETRRDWALKEYRDYDVYQIFRKYYTKTGYYKVVGEQKLTSGTEFLRTVQTGTDVLNSVTYRLGCVPSPDPVNAQKAQVVDLVCQAVAEGSGAQVTSIQALNLPGVGTVDFTKQNGSNRWLAKYFVPWFTNDGSYSFTIRVSGRDVEGRSVTHDIPMTLNVGNVSPDRPVGTIIVN